MKRHFIFTNKKHPYIAIMSSILGTISVLSFAFGIIRSFALQGAVTGRFGFAGALAVLYALAGLILSLYSFKIKEAFRLFAVIGLVLNTISLLVAGFLLWLPG